MINILCFQYQYQEWKLLFPEPPKTETSENRPISLVQAVVGFQSFHCIFQITQHVSQKMYGATMAAEYTYWHIWMKLWAIVFTVGIS